MTNKWTRFIPRFRSDRYFRWMITVILLVVVYRNSHWSVALSIALLTIDNEVESWTTTTLAECQDKTTAILKEVIANQKSWQRIFKND